MTDPTPMPADYEPTKDQAAFAIQYGKSLTWLKEEIAKCRDWHAERGIQRRSWTMTVGNWLRNAILFEQQRAWGREQYQATKGRTVGNGADVQASTDKEYQAWLEQQKIIYKSLLAKDAFRARAWLMQKHPKVRHVLLLSVETSEQA